MDEDKVKEVIEKVRPMLKMDGGDVELVGIEDDVVKVKLQGACHGCPSAAMTLQMGVLRALQSELPDIEGVIPV